jgi:hypothetical protein
MNWRLVALFSTGSVVLWSRRVHTVLWHGAVSLAGPRRADFWLP